MTGLMQKNQAEAIAIQSLGWLAADQELMRVFLGSSGADVNNLKEMAVDPAFLASVLDFILLDDSTVTGFCDAANLPYETPMRARQSLPGGAEVNWT